METNTGDTMRTSDQKPFIRKLKDIGACSEAVIWAGTQSDLPTLWANCERADWMLWLAGRKTGESYSQERKKLVGCAAECAATAIQYVKNKEWKAGLTEVAALLRRFSESEAGDETAKADVIMARDLAWEIRRKAYAAADAAAYAADAAAAYAADAADAAYAADAAAVRKEALKDLCEIVRKHYPVAPGL
jgi:hypothetical protein